MIAVIILYLYYIKYIQETVTHWYQVRLCVCVGGGAGMHNNYPQGLFLDQLGFTHLPHSLNFCGKKVYTFSIIITSVIITIYIDKPFYIKKNLRDSMNGYQVIDSLVRKHKWNHRKSKKEREREHRWEYIYTHSWN